MSQFENTLRTTTNLIRDYLSVSRRTPACLELALFDREM